MTLPLNSQTLILGGLCGLGLSSLLLSIFIFRRLRWWLRRWIKTAQPPPGVIAGLRNFILVLLLIAISGMLLFIGLFFRTYHRFTYEVPVAEIVTRPLGNFGSSSITQVRYRPSGNSRDRYFFMHGDQWMIAGDIIKWKPWLNLLGLDSRYRLTRLQGRYLDIEAERSAPRTVFSLIDHPQDTDERHPFWRFLYRSGQKLPLVDTIYGNAAYQDLKDQGHYQVFVGTSGFLIRKKGENVAVKTKK